MMLGRLIVILYRTILTIHINFRRRQIVEGRVPGAVRGTGCGGEGEGGDSTNGENDSTVELGKDTNVVIELPRQEMP